MGRVIQFPGANPGVAVSHGRPHDAGEILMQVTWVRGADGKRRMLCTTPTGVEPERLCEDLRNLLVSLGE